MDRTSFLKFLKNHLVAFLVGALLLSALSIVQKNMLGMPFSSDPRAFFIPVLFGGLSGLVLGSFYIRLRASRERIRDFLDNVDDIVQIVDQEGHFIFVNHAWYKTFGYTASEIKNLALFDLVAPSHLETCKELLTIIFNGERESSTYNTVFITKKGEKVYLEGKVNCRFENGKPISTRSILRNISENQKAREFQQIAMSIFEQTREGVAITNAEQKISFINDAFSKITGYSKEEALRKPVHGLFPHVNNTNLAPQEIKDALSNCGYWQGELWTKRKNNEIYPLRLTINTISDADGEITNYACIFSDIGERKRNELRMHHLATHDNLTELPNRDMFYQRALTSIEEIKENNHFLAILFLDLDGFKKVNDQYGHHAGDMFLKLIARRLDRHTRERDIVARFGGDEFAVLLSNIIHEKEAITAAENILAIIAEPYNLDGASISITASIGISIYTEGVTVDRLLIEADKAMYKAKREGKNRVSMIKGAT